MQTDTPEVIRRYAKYIFLDVVQFSKRSAEAQSEIVYHLNETVRQSLSKHNVKEEDCILIPTGDGMCIAFIGQDLPYDIHMQVALTILELVDAHNQATEKQSRQFQVRIGINQNTDILVQDINDRRNVAGAGINLAARVMEQADGGQILVSQTVYDELQPSEQYMERFLQFHAQAKHGLSFSVYQFIEETHEGLNLDTPNNFRKDEIKDEPAELKLTRKVAFYFVHAILNRKMIEESQLKDFESYAWVILLWFLATDSYDKSLATPEKPFTVPDTYKYGLVSIDEQLKYYASQDYTVQMKLARCIINGELSSYSEYLISGRSSYSSIFVNQKGVEKLKTEWLAIWEEFELDKYT
jgi:class 3 adenylate cyclase